MKTSQLKMIIREVVREEIRLGLQEIIGDMKKPKQQPAKQIKKVVENKNYSNNPIINQVLNETASDEWETMGDKKYTSDNMGEVLQSSYGKMMNNNDTSEISVDGQTADFMNKDYRGLLNAVSKRDKQKFENK